MSLSGPQPATGYYYARVANLSSGGNSNYNSMQVQVRKEMSHGLTSLTSFTWAHGIDEVTSILSNSLNQVIGVQNPFCLSCERASSNNDQRLKIIESFVYNTPEVAQRLFNTENRGVKYLVNDWQMGSIVTVGSGYPFGVGTGVDNSMTGGYDRPNLVPGVSPHLPNNRPKAQRLAQYFNPAAFTPNAIGSYGNVGRNTLIGPGAADVDFSLVKNFPISDRLGKFQLRFEFFNFLNKANFAIPANGISTPATVGKITSTTASAQPSSTFGNPRIIQFAGKYTF